MSQYRVAHAVGERTLGKPAFWLGESARGRPSFFDVRGLCSPGKLKIVSRNSSPSLPLLLLTREGGVRELSSVGNPAGVICARPSSVRGGIQENIERNNRGSK
jgi:hypothetical protein